MSIRCRLVKTVRQPVADRKANDGVALLAESPQAHQEAGFAVRPVLFETDAASFLKSDLDEEIFGTTNLLVQHSNREQVLTIARLPEGHLTATIQGTEDDSRDFADLIAILEGKVGRLIFNGFPTGVEVTHAIIHDDPYPATSDGRSTSVGSQAIFRFAGPVCYQDFPDSDLPQELRDGNPLGIWRMIDGEFMRGAVGGR
jgi:2,5-dioxopentanoate dehydrogenase